MVRSVPLDDNHDGTIDTWKLVLEVPMGNVSRGYRQLTVLAVYNMVLREKVLASIGGLVALDASAPFLATGFWAHGQLKLRQNQPLRVESEPLKNFVQSPLEVQPRSNWAARHSPITLSALLGRYARRSETVQFEQLVPQLWEYSPRERFRVELVMDVPPQLVQYVPPALEVLKFGWIQFLSFLLPTGALLQVVRAFAFNNQFVDTYVISHLPPRGSVQ